MTQWRGLLASTCLLSVATLTGCWAPMSDRECRTTNWYARGLDDGARGLPEGAFSDYTHACSEHGISPDPKAWEAGRLRGFGAWVCSDRRGYDAGTRGGSYETDCAAREQGEFAFLNGYLRGLNDRKAGLLKDAAAVGRGAIATISREDAERRSRDGSRIYFDLQQTRWLEVQVNARLRGGPSHGQRADDGAVVDEPRTVPWSPADHAALQHLFAGDAQIEQAARALAASSDPGARRAASMRLAAAARTLLSTAWRTQNRTRLEEGRARSADAIDAELDRLHDEQLAATLAGMEAVGGPKVVAFCFELAADESSAPRLRRAALAVLVRHIDPADTAARARGFALWERLGAQARSEAAPTQPPP